MNIELINTGTELMLGRVLNTHQQWLCRELSNLGYPVSRQVAIADRGPEILGAVREGLARADIVITTGGLGPTSDDITRDLIAELLQRELREDSRILAKINAFFEARKRAMPERTRVQALVPEGAIVLENDYGTAPGLAFDLAENPFRSGCRACLIMLPGPPRELRPMFKDRVVPLLLKNFPPRPFVCRTFRASGIGESVVEELIDSPLQMLISRGLELGYCSRPGQVDVRLACSGDQAAQLVGEAEAIVRGRIGRYLYGEEDNELEEVIIRLLTERKQTLALAESCTGGCIGHRLTNVPGASAVLLAGVISYSNDAKQKFLGVSAAALAEHGAVSAVVAQQMAEGARERMGADFALAVTGIAGPTGGTPAKPVGTVFIALARAGATRVEQMMNPFDRETFKHVTAQQAMELLRKEVMRAEGETAGPPV